MNNAESKFIYDNLKKKDKNMYQIIDKLYDLKATGEQVGNIILFEHRIKKEIK